MWGRLPGAGEAPGWVGPLHRWSGTIAFVVSLPVAFHCLWALGFQSTDTRVLVHSLAGCLFYGAYATKMIGLRTKSLPKWALPVLGGTVFTVLVVAWLTSALWYFTSGTGSY
jgi:thiamine transporter ThiT